MTSDAPMEMRSISNAAPAIPEGNVEKIVLTRNSSVTAEPREHPFAYTSPTRTGSGLDRDAVRSNA
jgi:hypothetical protein